VRDLRVEVRLAGRPKRVLLASTGRDLAFDYQGGFVRATVDRLDVYDLVVLEG
jgi:hypothetical protein